MQRLPSIVPLDKCPDIFSVKEVVATEKLHGSTFRMGFPLGMKNLEEIEWGSHEVEYIPGQDFPLNKMRLHFLAKPDLLGNIVEVIRSYGFSDVTIFGEAHGPGSRAKGVKYTQGQEPLFRAFGLMVGPNFVTYDLFTEICYKMTLPVCPPVWRGEPTQKNFDDLLGKPSLVGKLNGFGDDNLAEGVVIQSTPLLRDVFGDWLICKHKNPKFAEAPAPSVKIPRGPTAADEFASGYVTEGRVMNVLGHLIDAGTSLTNSMKDMPTLLTAVCADLTKECSTEMAELGINESSIKGNVSKVLAPIYREMLTKQG